MKFCEKADVKALDASGWVIPPEIENVLGHLDLRERFFKLADAENSKGNEPLAHCIALLGHAISMSLRRGDPKEPYAPLAEFGNGGRTALPEDFEPSHLEILERFLKQTKNPVLNARICDLLWLKAKPRKVAWAQNAISEFCALSGSVFDTDIERLIGCVSDLRRAIQLWKQTGSSTAIQTSIEAAIEKVMALKEPEPNNALRIRFFELLSEMGKTPNYARWIALGRDLATTSVGQKHYEKARAYWEAVEQLYLVDKNTASAQECRNNSMKLYAGEAREMRRAGANAMLLQHLFSKAIEAFRTMGGEKEEIAALHRELLEVQKDVVNELKPVGVSINLTEAVNAMKSELSALPFDEALLRVCSISVPPSKSDLFERAKKDIKDTPLQSIISKSVIDEKGKVVGKTDGMDLSGEDEASGVRDRASGNLQLEIGLKSQLIEIGRIELLERTDVTDEFLKQITKLNPFVPELRREQFLAGLRAGIRGSWIECAHILLPQLENSLRTLLDLAAVVESCVYTTRRIESRYVMFSRSV